MNGVLTQLAEYLTFNQKAEGSSPSYPTTNLIVMFMRVDNKSFLS